MGKLRKFIWPTWQQRKQLFKREAWLVVIAAYPLLVFAWLWPQNYRDLSTLSVLLGWISFLIRTLQFHGGLLLLLIAAIALLVRHRRMALASLPPMLFVIVPEALQYLPRSKVPVHSEQPLRVMTVNLLMVNENYEGIIGEIVAADPDVLLLQEYTPRWHTEVERRLGTTYPHESHIARDDSFGIAIRSKTPFVTPVDQQFRLGVSGVDQQRAVISHLGREYAIYHVHLLPPRSLAYYMDMRQQFADLCDALKAEKRPFIVCGDFNFSQTTPQHHQLMDMGLVEAHAQAGPGRGATWPVNGVFRYVPGIRIDHVYLSSELRTIRCATGEGRGSDHRPVVVDVGLTEERR